MQTKNFFVYGTLMFDEILKKLTWKLFKTKTAILNNYKRFSVKNRKKCNYPAILAYKNSKVIWKVLFDIDCETEKLFDFFEGGEYIKNQVYVEVNNQKQKAFVYVWNKSKNLLYNSWNPKDFEKNCISYYRKVIIPNVLYEFKKLSF